MFLYHYHPLCIQGFAKGSPTYTHLNLMCQLAAALAADTTALLDAQASFEAAFPDILTDMNFPARIYFLSHAILTTTTLCFGAIPRSGMDALLFLLSHLTQDLPPDLDTAGETLDVSYFTFSCRGIMHDEDVDDFITVLVHVFPPFQRLRLFTTALLISLELATTFAPTRELLMSRRTILHLVHHLNNPIQILRRSCQPSPATRVDGHVFGPLAVDMLPHPSFTPSYHHHAPPPITSFPSKTVLLSTGERSCKSYPSLVSPCRRIAGRRLRHYKRHLLPPFHTTFLSTLPLSTAPSLPHRTPMKELPERLLKVSMIAWRAFIQPRPPRPDPP